MSRSTGEPPENWNETIRVLNAAIARDPKFALAYCLLAETQLYIYRWGRDHSPDRLAAAKDAAETALRLEPALEEARVALARYFYDGLGDYRRTQEELLMVGSSAAHPIEYFTLAGLVQRRLGMWKEAIRNSEKAFELDPQDPQLAFNLVQNLAALKRFAEAERVADAAIHQLPTSKTGQLWRLKNEFEIDRGNLEAAHAALDAAPSEDDIDQRLARLWLCLLHRDFAAAQTLSRNASEGVKATPTYWLILGGVARATGHEAEAREAFQSARRVLESALEKRPGDPELLSQLAEADAGLGRNEDALREAKHAFEICPPELDAVRGPRGGTQLAEVLTWSGDHEGALNLLSTLVKVPFGPSYGDLKFNPAWDELRDGPGFGRILAESATLALPESKIESGRR